MSEETVLLRHPDVESTFRARESAVAHYLRSGWERVDGADPRPAPSPASIVAAPDVLPVQDPPTPLVGDPTEGA